MNIWTSGFIIILPWWCRVGNMPKLLEEALVETQPTMYVTNVYVFDQDVWIWIFLREWLWKTTWLVCHAISFARMEVFWLGFITFFPTVFHVTSFFSQNHKSYIIARLKFFKEFVDSCFQSSQFREPHPSKIPRNACLSPHPLLLLYFIEKSPLQKILEFDEISNMSFSNVKQQKF